MHSNTATTMFVRFRQTDRRLQISLVETRRIDGKVRHGHIASFGSVEWPPSVDARIAFWQRLHERLARLSNRVDAAAQAKILGDVHARIPMVTLDEQRALQLGWAKADEQFWAGLHDMHASVVEDHKGLAGTVEHAVAKGQAGMANAAEKRDAAKDRRERLERGEDVPGGLGKPLMREDVERILREAGWTTRDLRRLDLIGAVNELGPKIAEVFWRSISSSTDLIDHDIERKARATIKLFQQCQDPAELAKQMLEAMPKRSVN